MAKTKKWLAGGALAAAFGAVALWPYQIEMTGRIEGSVGFEGGKAQRVSFHRPDARISFNVDALNIPFSKVNTGDVKCRATATTNLASTILNTTYADMPDFHKIVSYKAATFEFLP